MINWTSEVASCLAVGQPCDHGGFVIGHTLIDLLLLLRNSVAELIGFIKLLITRVPSNVSHSSSSTIVLAHLIRPSFNLI